MQAQQILPQQRSRGIVVIVPAAAAAQQRQSPARPSFPSSKSSGQSCSPSIAGSVAGIWQSCSQRATRNGAMCAKAVPILVGCRGIRAASHQARLPLACSSEGSRQTNQTEQMCWKQVVFCQLWHRQLLPYCWSCQLLSCALLTLLHTVHLSPPATRLPPGLTHTHLKLHTCKHMQDHGSQAPFLSHPLLLAPLASLLVCSVDYFNPKMVVGCVVQHDNKILLCRRCASIVRE